MTRDEIIRRHANGERYFALAYLRGADLCDAYLSGVNLSRANLSDADLSGADLSGANLSGANLSGSYLHGVDLSGANLSRAYLSGADLSGAIGVSYAMLGEYQFTLIDGPTPMIHAGCRWFTVPEARAHWAEGNEANWTVKSAAYGARCRRILDFLTE